MRSLSRDARQERRVQVIRLRAAGQTYEAIAAQTGLSRTGVFDICQRHAAGGAKALRDAVGGRKPGEGRRLTTDQEAEVRKLICDKTPDQLKMPYALWTRGAVADLIEHRYGIRLPVRTMGLYLSRWGFTPQKPIRRAYEQSPAAVKQWLETDYLVFTPCHFVILRHPGATASTRIDGIPVLLPPLLVCRKGHPHPRVPRSCLGSQLGIRLLLCEFGKPFRYSCLWRGPV